MVFTAPAPGDVGTFGQSSELLAVDDGSWGAEFSALAWYKGSASNNPVLLQVSGRAAGMSGTPLASEGRAAGEAESPMLHAPHPSVNNSSTLQVAYADESSGDLRASATWRLNSFSDAAQG